MTKFIGIDPGLQYTGWGVVATVDGALRFVAAGVIHTDSSHSMSSRLLHINQQIGEVISNHMPYHAAIEETFVNNNYRSSLLLAQARGAAMVALAAASLDVAEYPANVIKKSIVGRGHADKKQMLQMLQYLMPGNGVQQLDAADALAVAVCHAHHMSL